jgi:cytochrome c biogenesis protein CcmG, thiol:disulfide interchange protein DsbE
VAKAGRQLAIGATAFALAILGTAGCGLESENGLGGKHPNYAEALAGAPASLGALYRQGNELLPGGLDAYERRIERLRGYPVVVNVWASWCGPCRFEFPAFQQASAEYGKRVAFLGVDSQDSTEEAQEFLGEEPVPYPSFSDPDEEIEDEIGGRGLPTTAFYDREGELVFLQLKPYTDHSELRADIERYALGQSG